MPSDIDYEDFRGLKEKMLEFDGKKGSLVNTKRSKL